MKNKIHKKLNEMTGEYSYYELFGDWVKMMAISISNTSDIASFKIYNKKVRLQREKEFSELAQKYKGNIDNFAELYNMLALALDENIEDVLGDIYMMGEINSKNTAQFFTPFNLSYATAKLTLNKYNGEPIRTHEPSVGSGGMVIATAKVIKEKGYNYQEKIDAVVQDIDWKAIYMAYVQLSLLGIKAKVIQGDTLTQTKPTDRKQVFYTPMYAMGGRK